MADANDKLSNLDPPTAINADLLPGTDNSIDLGSDSKRWKKLYLRADSGTAIEQYKDGVNPAKVLELDYRGITRSGFEGTATLTPAATGNPDVVEVILPRYIECDFVTFACGGKGVVTKNSTSYDVYPTWHAPLYTCSVNQSSFQAHVTWEVYSRATNKLIGGGPWNNLRQLCEDMTAATPYEWDVDDIATGTKTLHWIVRWPL